MPLVGLPGLEIGHQDAYIPCLIKSDGLARPPDRAIFFVLFLGSATFASALL